MRKPYTLVLKCGYAESEAVSSVAFSTRKSGVKFTNAREALLDLANWLKEKFLYHTQTSALKKCCENTKAQVSAAKFCLKCGTSLEIQPLDPDEFAQFIWDISETNLNDLTELIEWDDEARWDVEDIGLAFNSKAAHVRFIYQAELVLGVAAGINTGKTIDQIFSQRTEEGSNSFSYW